MTEVPEKIAAEEEVYFDAKVLVAEDNIINQKLIRRILEESGLTIDMANNGLEAFEKRRNGNYDLIFMDIQMPVMDGIEATHEILDYEEDDEVPHIPIVALTANALKGDRERFLNEGMDEYISKPLETAELNAVLNKFLKDKAAAKPAKTSKDIKTESMEAEEVTESTGGAPLAIEQAPNIESEVPAEAGTEEQKILIVKRNLLESRILAKMIQNLEYRVDTLDDLSRLSEKVASGEYDILIADDDLLPAGLGHIQEKVAIISLLDSDKDQTVHDITRGESISHAVSREILETLINKYRG